MNLNKLQKHSLKQFTMIHKIALMVYLNNYNGSHHNLYNSFKEYNNGVFGWIKEYKSFETAIQIYDEMTANEGMDILEELENELGEDFLSQMTYGQIKEHENDLADFELFPKN